MSNDNFTLRRSQWFGIGVLTLLVAVFAFVMFGVLRKDHEHYILVVLLGPILLVNGSLAYSRLRDFRRIRIQMEHERRRLEEIDAALRRTDDELQSRLGKERIERAEQEWIDSAVRSISNHFKSTIVPEEIAQFLVDGLGQLLGADIVIGYSFAGSETPGFLKHWLRQTDTVVDEPLIVKNELRLSTLVKRLWSRRRVIIVADSHLVNTSSDPLSELLAITKERARSWVLAPAADGSQVLGYVLVAMVENPRVWSSAEVALIQNAASTAANVCIHARMFTQAMQITENDAEVNRLVELDKVKTDLIENINHELRTPLASIIGYMEVVMEEVEAHVAPELVPSLAAVQRNAIRLKSLIENMMQVSNVEFQQESLNIAGVNLGLLLGDVVNSLEVVVADSGVSLSLRLDSPEVDLLIDGDKSKLEQLFSNLMSNAIKFTPHKGKVTVVARRFCAGIDYVEVKVIDTGIGIPHEEFPNVFKRFFRASTATQASIPGFGIGLSLVHSIVREHHGTITFDSTVGKGTVFTVTLPTRYISTKPSDETI